MEPLFELNRNEDGVGNRLESVANCQYSYGMGSQQTIEAIQAMIIAQGRDDNSAFAKAAELLIRHLSVENKLGEAKYLRDALQSINRTPSGKLSSLPRPSSPLIWFPPNPERLDLIFRPETEQALNAVISEYRAINALSEAGLPPKTKLLFWGPPGCGKTATCFWLGAQIGLPVGVVRLGSLITSYVGETGSNVQKIFAFAEQTPMILLLDEADAIAKSRDDDNDVGELRRVVNALLQGLDMFTSKRSLVVLATNHSSIFDSALWRRFDDIIEFPMPENAQRLELLKYATNGLKLKGSLDRTAKQLKGRSYDEIWRAVLAVAKTKVLENQGEMPSASIVIEANRWSSKKTAALRKRDATKRK